jgi:hypothetical protein
VAAISALLILAARPSEITDAGFLLSFSAVATIGAIAIPLIARSREPYRLALDHLSDVTRDVSHAPRIIQFRIEMRAAAAWISARLPRFAAPFGPVLLAKPFRAALYFREIIFISAILQLGMLPRWPIIFIASHWPGHSAMFRLFCCPAWPFPSGLSCWRFLSSQALLRYGWRRFWDSSSHSSTQPYAGSPPGMARATVSLNRPLL